MDTQRIIQIANDLGFADIVQDLNQISARMGQQDCPLVLPLVGEFSSGKTTLINALTDSKKLETATKPTTATIYEVHFGAENSHARVLNEDGTITDVDELSNLKNDILKDAKVVTVFDTSKRIPSSTILVDTPGLSSPDPKHKQTLVDFLPQADAILLVSDINQQVTRSLTEFVKTMSLSKRPIYLVLTKCDTKSPSDLEEAKKYISENIHIGYNNITCVSANADNLDELYALFNQIQLNKSKILEEVNTQTIKNLVTLTINRIDELLNSTQDNSNMEEEVRKKKYELDKLNRNIDSLLDSMTGDINEKSRNASRKFEDTIFDRLDTLVAGKSNNFDSEAVSAINNTSSLILNEFKAEIQSVLRAKAQARRGSDESVDLRLLSDIDMSQYSIEGLSYNLSLNTVGHEYDGYIATGVKIAGAVAAVATVAVAAAPAAAAGAGGTASVGVGGAAAETALEIATVADIADTVTDVSSIISNKNTVSKIQQAVSLAGQTSEQYANIQNYNQNIGQQMGASKGIVESMVGLVTDKTMGKPQRRRAIHDYMDTTLIPGFKSEISRISTSLSLLIRNALHQEAESTIAEMTNALEELHRIKREKDEEYNKRVALLRDYKNELSIL